MVLDISIIVSVRI